MSEETTPPQKTRYQFRWKTFLIDGVIAITCFLILQGAFFGVRSVVVSYYDMIERLNRDDRGDRRHRDNDRNQSLEDWVAANLPPEGEKEYSDVAEVFLDTAAALRDGKLRGQEDAFAETTRGLMAVATRRVWMSFLTDLTYRAKDERIRSSDDLADVFERIGNAIEDAAPRRSGRRTRAVETTWSELDHESDSDHKVESIPAAAPPAEEVAPKAEPIPEPVKPTPPVRTQGVIYGY